MSLLTAQQAVDYMARHRAAGRRALGYRRFLRLVATGRGPARVQLDDGGPALYSTAALDAWLSERTGVERAA